jgi:hypothetical protein
MYKPSNHLVVTYLLYICMYVCMYVCGGTYVLCNRVTKVELNINSS